MTTSAIERFEARADAGPEAPWLYRLTRGIGGFICYCTLNTHVLNPEAVERPGPFILALTHLSHLEPFLMGAVMDRKIDWMTRKEFYRHKLFAWYLNHVDAFMVDRQGVPVSAIRTGIARLREGNVVGICPEGGVTVGGNSVIRGGTIKRGVCSRALRTGAPIVPCVMLNTHTLNCVGPWLPYRRGTVYVGYGHLIHPPTGLRSTRANRFALAEQVRRGFVDLYGKMREAFAVGDESIP